MKEEIIISGRMIPHVDPHLELWHWPISLYLFLGGLSAGILILRCLVYHFRKRKSLFTGAIKKATIIVPFALGIGLIALMYDLTHIMYVWQLYATIRLESPMSWGAWILMLVTPLSVLFGYWVTLKSTSRTGAGKQDCFTIRLSPIIDWISMKNRIIIAWILIPSTLLLGMYTGILLSAFNARPLWNTSVLGILFLTSGLFIWCSRNYLAFSKP